MKGRRCVIGIMFGFVLPGYLLAGEWGNLCGQYVYDGEPPEPAKLRITKDEDECCKHRLVDESLVVNKENHGLKNVVIYLLPGRDVTVPVHPRYAATARQTRRLDNLACRFDPRVVLLWKRQTLVIGNSDPIGHNAMIDARKNRPLNVTIPSGGSFRHRFAVAERAPVSVSCSIHPWMRGWILVRDTPYMAVTDKDGKFTIKNLPVGEWEFVVWHEKPTFVTDVVRSEEPCHWKRGRFRWQIKSGDNDLGVVHVAAKLFQEPR